MKTGAAEIQTKTNTHEGHRDRMRQKFLEFGPHVFEVHELLELLLFGAIPRADVNDLAHRLLERFQTLPELFRASPDMIREVKGAGDQVAVLIKIVRELQTYLEPRDDSEDDPLTAPDMWFSRLWPYFKGARREMVYLLSLNSGYKYLDIRAISFGGEKNAAVNIRDLVDKALKTNAHYAVLAHNHINGVPEPSKQDIHTTSLVRQVLQTLDIKLLDHLIIYDETYSSILHGRVRFDI